MNYFFSACFLLIPKIIQLAISLAPGEVLNFNNRL